MDEAQYLVNISGKKKIIITILFIIIINKMIKSKFKIINFFCCFVRDIQKRKETKKDRMG